MQVGEIKKELSRTPEPKRHSLLLNDVAPLRHVQTVQELGIVSITVQFSTGVHSTGFVE